MVSPLPLTIASSGTNPERLLLYNGHLFKASVDEDHKLIVATLDVPITGEGLQWTTKYDICQDYRNPRCGLAFFKDSGLLIYVIYLLKHTVTKVLSNDELGFVGLSEGKPAVFMYYRDYLIPRLERQRTPALKLAYKAMIEDMVRVSDELQEVIP